MGTVLHFEDLDVWQKSAALYKDIMLICEEGKLKNDFSAKDQLKRAALSISNNIAEGHEYESNLQYIRFLRYAKGSAGEVRSMITVFYQCKLIEESKFNKLISEVTLISQSLKKFMTYLSNHQPKNKQ